jgi:hypothetical protein
LPEVSLVQCIFSDAGRVILSAWTAEFIAVCIEVSYGAVSCESSCCTRVASLDEIVKNDSTLWTKTDERRAREKVKKVE